MSNNSNKSFQPLARVSAVLLAIMFFISFLAGCENKLIPRDLKDSVSHTLKTERRNIEVTRPFRTTVFFRIQPMEIEKARQAEIDLINACVEYFRRDNVSNFINDTLVFNVRLDINPDIKLEYWTVAEDMRQVVKGEMNVEDFIDRCRREENWSEEL